jgi:hypothetical protein
VEPKTVVWVIHLCLSQWLRDVFPPRRCHTSASSNNEKFLVVTSPIFLCLFQHQESSASSQLLVSCCNIIGSYMWVLYWSQVKLPFEHQCPKVVTCNLQFTINVCSLGLKPTLCLAGFLLVHHLVPSGRSSLRIVSDTFKVQLRCIYQKNDMSFHSPPGISKYSSAWTLCRSCPT